MYYWIPALPYAAVMLVGMLICMGIGRRLGIRRRASHPHESTATHDTVETAVFALYGLLVAFTFSNALSQLDARRQLIQNEANAINTAYLRLDLLAADSQPAVRELFRQYVDSRLEIYHQFSDIEAPEEELSKSASLQKDIWSHALAASHLQGSDPDATKLLLPTLNEMFDVAGTRTIAANMHTPPVIFALFFLLALTCSLMAGYGMAEGKQVSWIHSGAFVAITVITIFVILELEYPRTGFIRLLTPYDQVLINLRHGMK